MFEAEVQRLLEWQRGGTPGPLHVLVFPTFRCNLNCAICSRHWKDEPRLLDEEMSTERLIRLVDESAELGTRHWTVGGGGEPLSRGNTVMELCRRIKHHGMAGSLQTNGTMFKPEQIDELVRLGWDSVSVSVDGHSADVSDRLRFPGAFDKATAALREFAAAKARHGRTKPFVNVACVLSRFNFDHMTDMVEAVREWGADGVCFTSMIIYADEMKDLEMTPEQLGQLRQSFERARAKAEELRLEAGLIAVPPDEPVPVLERKKTGNPYWNALCVEPWLTMVILTNGETVPCCVFGYGIAGSVRDTSLRDAWLGREMTTIRRMILNGVVMPACNECQGQYIRRRAGVLAALDRHEAFHPTAMQLARKAVQSFRRHGITGSARRAKEWITLRRKYDNDSRAV